MGALVNFLTAAANLVAQWLGLKKANTERANSETQIRREIAQAQTTQKDEIERDIRKAGENDKAALERLRRRAGE